MFDGIANRALENLGIEVSLDQIVGSAEPHRLEVYFAVAKAGENNDRRPCAALGCSSQKFNSAIFPQLVVEKINVVGLPLHQRKGGVEVFGPLQLKVPSLGLLEHPPNQPVIVLVVFGQQDLDG